MNTRNGNKKVITSTNALAPDDIPVFGEMRDAGPAAAPRAAAGAAAASRAAAGAAAAPRAAAPAVDLRGAAAAPAANDDAEVVCLDDILKSFRARAVHVQAAEKRKREEDEEQLRLQRVEHQKLWQKAKTELQESESALSEAEKVVKTLKEQASTSRKVLEIVESEAPPPSQADIDRVQRDQNIANWSKKPEKSDEDEPNEDEAGPNAVLNGGLLMAGNAFVGAGDLLRQASEGVTPLTVGAFVAGGLLLNRLFR